MHISVLYRSPKSVNVCRRQRYTVKWTTYFSLCITAGVGFSERCSVLASAVLIAHFLHSEGYWSGKQCRQVMREESGNTISLSPDPVLCLCFALRPLIHSVLEFGCRRFRDWGCDRGARRCNSWRACVSNWNSSGWKQGEQKRAHFEFWRYGYGYVSCLPAERWLWPHCLPFIVMESFYNVYARAKRYAENSENFLRSFPA